MAPCLNGAAPPIAAIRTKAIPMPANSSLLPSIQPLPEFREILRERTEFASPADQGVGAQINSSFDQLMVQSGLGITPTMLLAVTFCSAFTLGGVAFVVQENLLTTALAMAIGSILPVAGVMFARYRRQTLLMNQMPGMVDELSRAAKTGRSLEQCLELVAADTPAPLGDELKLAARKMELGLSLPEALRELPGRTGLVSLNVFTTALAVHHQTGGDLVTVLDRLARTIRDRISFLERLRSATATSRASSLMMIGLPPAIVAFFIFRDPEYLTRLMNATWGRNVTILAIILQVVGAAWVLRILRNSQRT